jgi:hypothetical protein
MASIPTKPGAFRADLAPLGVEVKFVKFVNDRPRLKSGKARSILIHTNSARGEGTVESAWNHAHAAPGENTVPTYQVDMTHGGVTRARKFLPSDLRPIANATATQTTKFKKDGPLIWPTLSTAEQQDILAHGNIRDWSLAIETADTGTDADPGISAFDAGQMEIIAAIVAYESIVHGFPLRMLDAWHASGVGGHTSPFGFPFTTIKKGKFCPGDKKKAQIQSVIIPRAIAIRDAWRGTATPEPAKPEPVDEVAAATGTVPPDVVPEERSANVLVLQLLLIRLGIIRDNDDNRDRHYGPGTQKKIKAFQASHGITPDGHVRRDTWIKLMALVPA